MSVKVGDEVLLEQCYEDTTGAYHDEYVTVTKIDKDGRCTFRIADNKRRWKIQAFINQQEYYAHDLQAKEPQE
jgi:hypothetical protein